ncbi:hypothetical protein SAMN06265365_1292 [Tistlia consotensis]|uniref:Zinc-finger n=1 Tax=Tistlia consotensis USBA 355 TaxID=560819 RepID=A0A1Y6CT16_9PROT|nr:hypothetical protein [Tistlia consotensis]SMF75748.1 hypothetical protein SAMN05428998_13464 [Tistlia consotensis USBA 355]SNS07452.1 hypothetical protein SAMN06265365_1292 [Tistlia consotensis]
MAVQIEIITEEILVAYLRGGLSEAERREIEAAAIQDERIAEVLTRCRSIDEGLRAAGAA